MTHSAHESEERFSYFDSAALCQEIGETLRANLDRTAAPASPHLKSLMIRLVSSET